jgi:hypothetical protein
MAGKGAAGPGRCEVGGVLRPALGCLRAKVFFRGKLPTGKGRVEVDLPVPKAMRARHAVVEARVFH